MTLFTVVDIPSTYNVILGHPTLRTFIAIASQALVIPREMIPSHVGRLGHAWLLATSGYMSKVYHHLSTSIQQFRYTLLTLSTQMTRVPLLAR